jgi:hypothetical protein
MRYIALFFLCLPLEADVTASVDAVVNYYPASYHKSCGNSANASGPVDIGCSASGYGASAYSFASSHMYSGYVSAHVNHGSFGHYFVASDASLDFSDTIVILGGVGEGELWGQWWRVSDNSPCCSYSWINDVPFPGPVHFTFGTPISVGYSIRASAGSDGPGGSHNNALLDPRNFQVFDASGAKVNAQFYSAQYGRLFVPEPSLKIPVAVLLLYLAAAERLRHHGDRKSLKKTGSGWPGRSGVRENMNNSLMPPIRRNCCG